MNDTNDESDPRLAALFEREHAHLPAEPFSSAALRAVAAARTRAALTRRAAQAAAVLALVVLSPALINASIRLSRLLDASFALVSSWLATPIGMIAGAALAALAAGAAKRARMW